jgi:RimJ/RimL family protein N-acetyltransferase
VPDAFVSEVDGAIVGWAPSATGWIFVGVDPAHRRRGTGGELLERVAELRRGERVVAMSLDEDGARFLERRGFEPAGTLRTAMLQVREAVLPESQDISYAVVPLADVRHRVQELYELYMDTLSDVPNAEGFLAQTVEEWQAHVLDNPILDDRISVVVLDGEQPVALALLVGDGRRAAADYAGTARSHRGRGLATLAKIASTRAAQVAGIETIATENDVENPAMIRINERLGFRPGAELRQFARVL